MGFGAYLRGKREERNMTLAQVAGKLGISLAYLSRIERDRENAPKDELIGKMCEVLGLSPEETDQAYAKARRFPPDLQKHAAQVIAAYRKTGKKD